METDALAHREPALGKRFPQTGALGLARLDPAHIGEVGERRGEQRIFRQRPAEGAGRLLEAAKLAQGEAEGCVPVGCGGIEGDGALGLGRRLSRRPRTRSTRLRPQWASAALGSAATARR